MMVEMPRDPAPATILVVDDEPPLLRLVTRVLERHGFRVLCASDCGDAIDLFDKHLDTIDAVLLDIVIPPRGGAEVMDHMVAARSDLVVVLSSGDSPEPELIARLKSHGGAFLRKPFLPKVLIELLETQLEARHRPRPDKGHNEPVPGLEHEEV
jgi:DNA-binding response OmpR family regulator